MFVLSPVDGVYACPLCALAAAALAYEAGSWSLTGAAKRIVGAW